MVLLQEAISARHEEQEPDYFDGKVLLIVH